jgi:hypothetical protein
MPCKERLLEGLNSGSNDDGILRAVMVSMGDMGVEMTKKTD